MRRFTRLLLLAVLTAAAGTLSPLPGHGQDGGAGPPPGVIDKPAAEADVVISIRPTQPLSFAGEPVSDFLRFTVNQRAAIYLLEIDPSGTVSLLFPNRLARQNVVEAKEYVFPQDFMGQPFQLQGSEGTRFIQAIAVPFLINLSPPPADSSDLFTVLGDDPVQVKENILRLIEAHGISRGAWAADWATYELLTFIPFAADTGFTLIRLQVVRREGDGTVPVETLFKPQVSIGPSNVRDDPPWTRTIRFPEEGEEITVLKNNEYVDFEASARFHLPNPTERCTLEIGTAIRETREPCRIEGDELAVDEMTLIFELEAQGDPQAVFDYAPRAPEMGQAIAFDASFSRPRNQISSYEWDFGDGTQQSTEEPLSAHSYSTPGVYTARLTIALKGGTRSSFERTLQVTLPLPSPCPPPQRLCLELATGNFDLVSPLEEDRIAIRGSNGAATVEYTRDTDFQAGPATLRFDYAFQAFPSPEAITAGQVFVQSFVRVMFLDEDGVPITTSEIRFLVQLGERPFVGRTRGFTQDLVVPDGAREARVQIATQASQNQTGERVQVEFSNFRWESEFCQTFLSTDRQVYAVGQLVAFTFCNLTDGTIDLPNSAPWSIKDQNGQIVFTPETAQQVVQLQPNATSRGVWDQRDNDGRQVPSGTYTLEFRTLTRGTFTVTFVID